MCGMSVALFHKRACRVRFAEAVSEHVGRASYSISIISIGSSTRAPLLLSPPPPAGAPPPASSTLPPKLGTGKGPYLFPWRRIWALLRHQSTIRDPPCKTAVRARTGPSSGCMNDRKMWIFESHSGPSEEPVESVDVAVQPLRISALI